MAKVKTHITVGTLGDQYLLSITRLNLKSSVILSAEELDNLEQQIRRAKRGSETYG